MNKNNKELDQEQLKEISGGDFDECVELKDFIGIHDPMYPINKTLDIVNWLKEKSGLQIKKISTFTGKKHNYYTLSDGMMITQTELMTLLKEKFPEEEQLKKG